MVSWSVKDGTGKASNLGDRSIEEPQNAVGMSGYSECSIISLFNSKPLDDFPRRTAKGAYGVLDIVAIVGPGKVRLGLNVLVELLRYNAGCVRSWIPHGGRQDRRKWSQRTSTAVRKNMVRCGLSNGARKNMMEARDERHRSEEHGGGRWQRRMSDDSEGQGESRKMDEQWLSRGYGGGAGRALSLRVRSYHST